MFHFSVRTFLVLLICSLALLAIAKANAADPLFGPLAVRQPVTVTVQEPVTASATCDFGTLRARQPLTIAAAPQATAQPVVNWSGLSLRAPARTLVPPPPSPATGLFAPATQYAPVSPFAQQWQPQQSRCRWTPYGWQCR